MGPAGSKPWSLPAMVAMRSKWRSSQAWSMSLMMEATCSYIRQSAPQLGQYCWPTKVSAPHSRQRSLPSQPHSAQNLVEMGLTASHHLQRQVVLMVGATVRPWLAASERALTKSWAVR